MGLTNAQINLYGLIHIPNLLMIMEGSSWGLDIIPLNWDLWDLSIFPKSIKFEKYKFENRAEIRKETPTYENVLM